VETEPATMAKNSHTTPPIGLISPITVGWPPLCRDIAGKLWACPLACLYAPLPLWITDAPNIIAAAAAHIHKPANPKTRKEIASEVITQYLIGTHNMKMIYMLSDPYGQMFEATLDLRKCDLSQHQTAVIRFLTKNSRLLIATMDPGTPSTRIDKLRTNLHGTWLILIDSTKVTTITDAQAAFACVSSTGRPDRTLVLSHPDISPNISNRGLSIMATDDFS
jgi:hypothetical protein